MIANKTRRPRRTASDLAASQAECIQGRHSLFDNSTLAPNEPIFDAAHPAPHPETNPIRGAERIIMSIWTPERMKTGLRSTFQPRSHGPRGNAFLDAPRRLVTERCGRGASQTAFPRGPWERVISCWHRETRRERRSRNEANLTLAPRNATGATLPKRTVMPIGMGTRPHENGELGWIGRSCRGYFQRKPKSNFKGTTGLFS